jgi:hypothetical protein
MIATDARTMTLQTTRNQTQDQTETQHQDQANGQTTNDGPAQAQTSASAQAPTQTRARAGRLDLSVTQLLGGSAAAATAAALGSRLGVVGTIAGAAVLSLISAVAASLYTASMTRARDAVVLVRSRRGDLQEVPVSALEAPEPLEDLARVAPRRPTEPRGHQDRQRWWTRLDRSTTRRVLVTTGALFAIAAAFLTGLQLTTGAQVTGTTIGGRVSTASGADSPAARVARVGTSPTTTGGSGTSGTPAPGSTGDGAASPETAGPGQSTGSATVPATPGSGQATGPASTGTAPATTSGTPAAGIPTGSPTPTGSSTPANP